MFDKEAHGRRIKWFCHDRFGMFIHWGLYALPARGEWIRSVEEISAEDYRQYFEEFDPTQFDPEAWARAAKDAGMKYAVLTAKHHDGFCLFDSALTDYKSTNTRAKRDLVKEFLAAFRAQGIRVGLYYSLIDWHHKDYPHFGERYHPMRNNKAYQGAAHDFDNYLDYMHGQIKELCTNYGKLDIMWFDFSYDTMTGEKWKAAQLVKMIRTHQPDIILDNRLEASGEGFGSLYTGNPSDCSGDFVSPEQIIPPNGLKDTNGNPLPWEACVTMNDNWGYCATDNSFKPASTLIKKLVECVSKDGNLLLNVGPDARGLIPQASLNILKEIGKWMRQNSDSIYGCGCAGIAKPENGRVTAGRDALYFHITEDSLGDIPLYGVSPDDIQSIRLLRDKSELKLQKTWITGNYPDVAFIRLPSYMLDPVDTVVKVRLKPRG